MAADVTPPPAAAPRWPGLLVLLTSAVVGVLVVFTLWRHPGVLHDPAAPVFLALLVAVMAVYVGCAGWSLRHPRPGGSTGVAIGTVAGAMWSVEIWAGGPAELSRTEEQAIGGTFVLLAVASTLAAGIRVGLQDRARGSAVRAGLFAGLTSGVVVFLVATTMTLATLPTLASRSDYQRQYASSHAADIGTFLTGDILAAVTAHLVINLGLGMLGAALGALITSRRGTPGTSTTTGQVTESGRCDRL